MDAAKRRQRFAGFLREVADKAMRWEYGDGTPMYRDARAFLAHMKRQERAAAKEPQK